MSLRGLGRSAAAPGRAVETTLSAAVASLSVLGATFAACGGEPVRPVESSEAKAWSRTPLTPEWSDIAKDVAGDHVRECEAVYLALSREEPCQASDRKSVV